MGLAFSVLEFLAELGGMEEISTEGIAHGDHDSEKEEAGGDWGDDESPKDEDDLEGGGEDKEDDRSAEDQGLAGIAAPPPGRGGGRVKGGCNPDAVSRGENAEVEATARRTP